LFLLLSVFVILNGYGLIALVLCLLIAWIVGSVINVAIAHRYVAKIRLEIDWDFLRGLLAPIIAFGLTGLAGQIFLRVDIIMLSKIKDMDSVALFTPVGKTLEICSMLPLTFYILILPIAAKVLKDFHDRMPSQLENSVRQLFILVFLEFGLVFFFAGPILTLVYGNAYVEAAGPLRILIVSLLFMTGEMTLVMCCQAGGYHKLAMIVAIVRTSGKIILSFILIPIWGPMGAALATLVSIGISFVVLDHFVRIKLCGFRWLHMIKEPALVCILVMFAVLLLADRLQVLYLGLLFIAGYLLLLLAVNKFSLERLWSIRH
jgi:PST family polysaccharide transporter